MSHRRSLDPEERALWNRVVNTVKPLKDKRRAVAPALSGKIAAAKTARPEKTARPGPSAPKSSPRNAGGPSPKKMQAPAIKQAAGNLNSHWDRRFHKGAIQPDVTVDLHGVALAGAYARMDAALEQAIHQNMRVMLLITGKQRRHDRASGQGRGAIASVVRDWLSASRHAANISAVRGAHPRHGGNGALYIILKRR